MINITKLYCGLSQPADSLRYRQGHGEPRSAAERKPIVPLSHDEAATVETTA